jgi:hypothetical protein
VWIKAWIVIGFVAFLIFFGLPVLMFRNEQGESARFVACANHTRRDCDPSITWYANGWDLMAYTLTSTNTVPEATTSTSATTIATSTNPVLDVATSTKPAQNTKQLPKKTKSGEITP